MSEGEQWIWYMVRISLITNSHRSVNESIWKKQKLKGLRESPYNNLQHQWRNKSQQRLPTNPKFFVYEKKTNLYKDVGRIIKRANSTRKTQTHHPKMETICPIGIHYLGIPNRFKASEYDLLDFSRLNSSEYGNRETQEN